MLNKTKRNSSTQIASTPMKRRFTRFSIIDLVIAAPLLIAIFVMTTLPLAEEASGAPPVTDDPGQRANAAISARYSGLATFYAAEKEPVSNSSVLASNPELSIVYRYTDPEEKIDQPVRFDSEQLRQTYFNDWAIEADAADPNPVIQPSDNLADNPELSIVRRYTTEKETGSDSSVLASNPELSVVRRHIGSAEEIDQPVRFDSEHLRQSYFNDWAIESEAVDVSLVEPPGEVNLTDEQETYDFWIEVLRRNYDNSQSAEVDTATTSPVDPAPHGSDTSITFDSEALRDTYFDDWGIEADAVDVTRQPVRFDTEHLRQTYFQDWGIEADAVE